MECDQLSCDRVEPDRGVPWQDERNVRLSRRGDRMRFAPGEILLRRSWRGGRISFMTVTRVAADDESGLRLWLPIGSSFWRLVADDGSTMGDVPIDQMRGPRLREQSWTGSDAMIWM